MAGITFFQGEQPLGDIESLQNALEQGQLNGPVYMDLKTSYRLILKDAKDSRSVVIMLLQAKLPPHKIVAITQIIEAYWQTENEVKDSKEINGILARYFDGDYGNDDETNNKVLLPLTNTNPETSALLLYEEEDTFCSAEEIREAYEEVEQERKVLRREKISFENDKKRNKDDSSQRSRDDSSQRNNIIPNKKSSGSSNKDFKLQDVMPLVDLPRLIDNYYPDAKVNLTATKPRCKAVWRGGGGFNVSLQRNSVGKWRFYDFKTGQSGDAYDFLVDIAGMDKSQARTEIASLVGVDLPESGSSSKHLDFSLDQGVGNHSCKIWNKNKIVQTNMTFPKIMLKSLTK